MKNIHKIIKDEILTSKDVVNCTIFFQEVNKLWSEISCDVHKDLLMFDTFSKWEGLLYLMKNHYSRTLISKTDLARSMPVLSRDGSLKFINSLLKKNWIYEFVDPAIDRDKRKKYIMPHKDLLDAYVLYLKTRLLAALNAKNLLTIGDKPYLERLDEIHKLEKEFMKSNILINK